MSDKKITDQDYLFLSAMVKAREAKMLTADLMERMLAAPKFEDAAKILVDCGYDDMSRMSAVEVEKALSERRAAIFYEISSMSPEKGVADAFRLKYDYHNAKVVIKSRGAGVEGDDMLSDSGRVPANTMVEAYDTDDYRFIPGTLAAAIVEARGILARTNNPQLSDFCLDKAYFQELKQLSEAMSGKFLKSYVKTLIDSANIRAAVRTLRMGRGLEFLRTALVEGGNVNAERLANSTVSEGMSELFASSVFAETARLGDEAAHGGALTAFEMACDNAVITFLKNAKLVSFGDAPVIAYLAAVENEITAVRMILTGRLAGISPETIRERLRLSYA
ncbi:MAG: V-type ATPase subunit [Oscillospiraceae bacterium]